MTRRPRTVSGTAGPGLIGVRLVPTVLLADADRGRARDGPRRPAGGRRPVPTCARSRPPHELDDYLHNAATTTTADEPAAGADR